jgi:hypothetical protein
MNYYEKIKIYYSFIGKPIRFDTGIQSYDNPLYHSGFQAH